MFSNSYRSRTHGNRWAFVALQLPLPRALDGAHHQADVDGDMVVGARGRRRGVHAHERGAQLYEVGSINGHAQKERGPRGASRAEISSIKLSLVNDKYRHIVPMFMMQVFHYM